jgi:hypothetical protein
VSYDAEDMRIYRVETGRTKSLTVPVSVLAEALGDPLVSPALRRHFGPFLSRAIEKAPKA